MMSKIFFNKKLSLRVAFWMIMLLPAIGVHAQVINTIAGGGTNLGGGNGGPATGAGFSSPDGIAVDTAGNVFIADLYNGLVWKMDSATGVINIVAGGGTGSVNGPATSANIGYPYNVAVDKYENLYIVDGYDNRVLKVDASGMMSIFAGDSNGTAGYTGDGGQAIAATLNTPNGCAVDTAGNVYIADTYNSVVRKVSTTGIITTIIGNGIQGYTGDGGQATAAEINDPFGVTVDLAGNLYTVDNSSVARKVNTSGVISTIAGTGTIGYSGDGGLATAATLYFPQSIVLDAAGNIYIADLGNNVIRKINTSGIISTVAGDGSNGYSGNGSWATQATLSQPYCMMLDRAGNYYIADAGNNVIREVTFTCNVVTAGNINSSVGNGVICSTNNDTLTLTGGTPDINGISYQWQSSSDGVSWANTGSDTDRYTTGIVSSTMYYRAILSCLAFNHTDTTAADTLTVANSIVAAVNITTTSSDTLCAGSGIMFIAHSTNGGFAPSYQWSDNNVAIPGATNNNYATTSLSNGDAITCTMTTSFACATEPAVTSNGITVTINPITVPAVSISADPGVVTCVGALVTFTATGTNSGTTPSYQWMENDINIPGATNSTYTNSNLDSEDVISCAMSSSLGCVSAATVTSNTETMQIITALTPTISITASPGTTISPDQSATFTTTITGGGNAPAYQWQRNGVNIAGATNSTYVTNTLSDSSVITCVLTSNFPCVDSNNIISNSIVIWVSSGVASIADNTNSIVIYPDPNKGTFSVQGSVPDDRQVQMEVLNMIGQVIYQTTMPIQNKMLSGRIALDNKIADGTYFLRIKTDSGSSIIRFIIEK